jgi:hypothetical protein
MQMKGFDPLKLFIIGETGDQQNIGIVNTAMKIKKAGKRACWRKMWCSKKASMRSSP